MATNIYQKDIDGFKSLLEKWINAYNWREISYLALKSTEGPVLIAGRMLLDTSKTASPFKFESEHIMAGRDVVEVSAEEARKSVEEAIAGKLTVYGVSISLAPDNGRQSFYFDPFYQSVQFGPRSPILRISGKQKYQLLSNVGNNSLDWEVRSADVPFYNLDEILAIVGLPSLLQMGDSTRLELLVRWPAMIANTSIIENGFGRIRCLCADGIDVAAVKLGYTILYPTLPERGHLSGDAFNWQKDGDVQVGTIDIKVNDAALVQVFLSYKGEALHTWLVSDPQKHLNPRHAIYEAFDNGAKLLKQFLLEPKKDSDQFEIGFSLLLNLLGFSTSHHGLIPKLQEGPDIIALTPGGKIAVVECTTGLLDEKGKLAKLIQRTKIVEDKLKTSGHGYMMIQPVIVTALSRDRVSAHIEEATKHKIFIVCREDIEVLLNQIVLPPAADRYFQLAVQTVSGADQESLF